jgi:hypothetical protein
LADLLPALVEMKNNMAIDGDGMYTSSFKLEPSVASPFLRALMRAEAELLIEDADSLGTPHENHRTAEQRAADALVRLVLALPPP